MARRPRSSVSASYFHVHNRSVGKAHIFMRPNDYRAFLAIMREGLTRHPVRLLSYCVLSNHWHFVLGPNSTRQLSKLMHWVTVTHSVRWRHHGRTVGEGPVYQGRFKSHPIDALDVLMRTCRYVERNALSAGLVRRAQDWPWCSLGDRLRPEPRLPLVSTPFLVSDAWIEYVNAPIMLSEQSEKRVPGKPKTVENRHDPYVTPPITQA